jgi:DHA3 family macrolide efflux protein-like MFS transporter
MRSERAQLSGLWAFGLVWLGQLLSILATSMTQFGLTLFVYEKAGAEAKATALGLMQVFYITPFLLISPVAGVMVDRYNRKWMMMVSDLLAGAATVGVFALLAVGVLEVWHLYLAAIFQGLGNAFQWPAYSAAMSVMVPKAQLGRANGLWSLLEVGPNVFAPLLAGALLPFIGLTGLLAFDIATFVLAIGALLLVSVPQPPRTQAGREGQGNWLTEAVYGFRYIFARPGLLGLQMVFFFGNLFTGIGATVFAAMILTRSGDSQIALSQVMTAGAVGGLIGGLVMSAWGGSRRKVHGVLLGHVLSGFLSLTLLGLGRGVSVWMVSSFLGTFLVPWIDGSNQAIWQAKVAPDVQGRVFSARRLIAWFTQPIAPLIAGPLADRVLEPGMRAGGNLAGLFGGLTGVGPGTGMALLLIVIGVLSSLFSAVGYLVPAVRDVESILPDHEAAPAVA